LVFDEVLVDEYQDTIPLQRALIGWNLNPKVHLILLFGRINDPRR